MAILIRRREFIVTLGSAAAWPLAAYAQQSVMPVIGFLDIRSAAENKRTIAEFRQGLAEAGFVEGRNVVIEFRWAEGRYDRLPALAEDLVRRQAAVIVATGAISTALAAKAATSTIPIVFMNGSDPVKYGLVASFNRPAGNLTGVNLRAIEIAGKRLELLSELVPRATTIAFLSGGASMLAFEEQKSNMLTATRAKPPGDALCRNPVSLHGRVPVRYEQGDDIETNTLSFCIESQITREERYLEKMRTAEAMRPCVISSPWRCCRSKARAPCHERYNPRIGLRYQPKSA
jgi:hypothetical protein